MPTSYANVTLTSLDGDLSVVVYLPKGIKTEDYNDSDEPELTYYYGSRFEHGSMIGSITRKRRYTVSVKDDDNGDSTHQEERVDTHVLYGTDTWRQPHNWNWPESGVGLASEFGVGDDGALCYFRCGWPEATDVTNGVLGYQEARNGDTFLKIGVGELVKGTCPACDSTDDYRFNSPYLLAEPPKWRLTRLAKNSHNENSAVQLEHEARLRNYGYKLIKDVSLTDNVLSVTTTLQNLGDAPFSTVWYSHHFFTCDGEAVGPGYSLDLNIKGDSSHPLYEEPGTWTWATPLQEYAIGKLYHDNVHVKMTRPLDPGIRIKAEFLDDGETNGDFTLSACQTSIEAELQSLDFQSHSPDSLLSMYAYNLYIERGTFSPEPQLLIRNLQPGQTVSWTLQLSVNDKSKDPAQRLPPDTPWWTLASSISLKQPFAEDTLMFSYAGVITLSSLFLLLLNKSWTRYRRRRDYNSI